MMNRIKIAFGILGLVTMVAGPAVLAATPAKACTNSSDYASDGSRCGGRASGCKAGGRGGIC